MTPEEKVKEHTRASAPLFGHVLVSASFLFSFSSFCLSHFHPRSDCCFSLLYREKMHQGRHMLLGQVYGFAALCSNSDLKGTASSAQITQAPSPFAGDLPVRRSRVRLCQGLPRPWCDSTDLSLVCHVPGSLYLESRRVIRVIILQGMRRDTAGGLRK